MLSMAKSLTGGMHVHVLAPRYAMAVCSPSLRMEMEHFKCLFDSVQVNRAICRDVLPAASPSNDATRSLDNELIAHCPIVINCGFCQRNRAQLLVELKPKVRVD